MVATELAEDDAQLEVRIIRTKGGIKNVAYIAENDNSLIVHQKTTSTKSGPNIEKNNKNLQETPGLSHNSKFGFDKANILDSSSSSSDEYSLPKIFNNKILPLTNSDIELEVTVPKVSFYISLSSDLLLLKNSMYQTVQIYSLQN